MKKYYLCQSFYTNTDKTGKKPTKTEIISYQHNYIR